MRLVEVKTLQRVQETFPHHEGKKLSDIQVGDLIKVEKVDAFLIYFRHVYTSY